MSYEFLPEVFLRTPFYSYEDYDLFSLPDVIKKADFQNAIFLASPEFYSVLEKKDFHYVTLNEKEKFTLFKYYNRMCFRSTPFGSFASFTNIKWTADPQVALVPGNHSILHLLPDQKVRIELIESSVATMENIDIVLNPQCYLVGLEYRFVKVIKDHRGHFKFTLNTIAAEGINESIANIAKSRIIKSLLVEMICKETDCAESEAENYVNFLIREQFLYTPDFGHVISNSVRQLGESEIEYLNAEDFWQTWKNMPLREMPPVMEAAQSLATLLKEKDITIKRQYFYSAVERPLASGGLNNTEQKRLLKAIELMHKISGSFNSPNITQYIKQFKEKFDQAKVPLLIALDPDAGISYGNLIDDDLDAELLGDLNFPQAEREPKPVKWSKLHQRMLKLWTMDRIRSPYGAIILGDSFLDDLGNTENKDELPNAVSIMFRKQNEKLLLESLGGATAAALIGRFTKFSKEVEDLSKKLAKAEIDANENVVFADISQLSDEHVDNINRRYAIYDYEIPINVYSNLSEDRQVNLNDLVISVINDELILESLKLGKRVIPRLTSAYNPTKTDLSVFRLLCDLQHQGIQSGMSFELERLFPGMSFYPAVEYKNVVLCPAKWMFAGQDIVGLKAAASRGRMAVHDFLSKYGVPNLVMLGNFDQQLVFNLDDEQQVFYFSESIKGEKSIQLKEFISPDDAVTAEGKSFAGQFIAFLSHKKRNYGNTKYPYQLVETTGKRRFAPGSEWLYIKLYCTSQSANRILVEAILPLISNKDLAKNWFFIRYADDGYHLRLRIFTDTTAQAILLSQLNSLLDQQDLLKMIREFKIDTYNRELERYGGDLIADIESLFCKGSELILNFLYLKSADKLSITSLQLSLSTIIKMLNSSFPELDMQIAFVSQVSDNFLNEFSATKELKVQLDRLYRIKSPEISFLNHMDFERLDNRFIGELLKDFLAEWNSLTSSITDRARVYQLLGDVFHMQVNRLFENQQRKHEMIIYYFLRKCLLSKKAKRRG